MLRTIRQAILACVLCLAVSPAGAAVGVNLYGISWHISRDDLEWFNPGLGIKDQFLRGENWKADAVAGVYRDSFGDPLAHLAVGGQFRLLGPTFLGAYLMAGANTDVLDEVWVAPLPAVTVEAGPLDLNVHYIPRIKGVTGDSAVLGFHVTIWPFGGRAEADPGPRDPDARLALEFAVDSGPRLTALDGQTLSMRWTPNARHAWRAGLSLSGTHRHLENTTYRAGDETSNERTVDQAEVAVLVQHLWLFPSSRGTRFFLALGPRFAYDTAPSWEQGLALGLGAEVDLVAGLSLFGEATTVLARALAVEYDGDRPAETSIEAAARLGVALWW